MFGLHATNLLILICIKLTLGFIAEENHNINSKFLPRSFLQLLNSKQEQFVVYFHSFNKDTSVFGLTNLRQMAFNQEYYFTASIKLQKLYNKFVKPVNFIFAPLQVYPEIKNVIYTLLPLAFQSSSSIFIFLDFQKQYSIANPFINYALGFPTAMIVLSQSNIGGVNKIIYQIICHGYCEVMSWLICDVIFSVMLSFVD